MTIAFPCEKCGHRYELDASLAGRRGKCKKCDHVFVIPAAKQPRRAEVATKTAAPTSKPKKVAVPPAPAKVDEYYGDDPYGFDEELSPPKRSPSPVAAADDEEFLPPRAAKPVELKKKKKRRSGGGDGFTMDDLPWFVFKYGMFAVLGTLLTYVFGMRVGAVATLGVFGLVTFSLYAIGSIGMLVVPFQESAVCGLMNLFVPFYSLYYLATRWDAMARWFLSSLTALGMFLVMAFGAAILLPAVVPVDELRAAAERQQQAQRARMAGMPVGGGPGALKLPPDEDERPALAVNPAQNLPAPPDFGGAMAGRPNNMPPMPTMPTMPPMPNFPNRAAPPNMPAPPNFAIRRPGRPDLGARNRPGGPDRLAMAPGNLPAPPPVDRTDEVTLRVKGGVQAENRALLRARLSEAMRGEGHAFSKQERASGDVLVMAVWPVKDVQGLADKLTVGRVTGVKGRTIELEMPKAKERPTDSEFVDQAIHDLASPLLDARSGALKRLQSAPPDEERREEVSKAIEPMLRDPNGWGRTDAAKALAVWGGPENTPALLKALKDPDFGVRWAVLDTLKELKDPEAAEGVAEMLTKDRQKASDALKAMGPGAEPAVIPFLKSSDVFVRVEACKILQEIGAGEDARVAIFEMGRRANGQGLDGMAAKSALDVLGYPRAGTPKRKSIVPGTSKRR